MVDPFSMESRINRAKCRQKRETNSFDGVPEIIAFGVLAIIIISTAFFLGTKFGESEIRNEAVRRGFAEKIEGDDGRTVFRWIVESGAEN